MDEEYLNYKVLPEFLNINSKLKEYINENILPKYTTGEWGGHDLNHIEKVTSRSFELAKEFDLDVNFEMIYTIASFHDLGYKNNPNNHAYESSIMLLHDKKIKEFFSEEEIRIMACAIEDHPANLEYEARSVYGKIISSADREISVKNILRRAFLFQQFKHKDEHLSNDEIVNLAYNKLSSKYGENGYAIMYYKDEKYKNFLKGMEKILKDKEVFKNETLGTVL